MAERGALATMVALVACSGGSSGARPQSSPVPASGASATPMQAATAADSASTALVPGGYGTLRQDDIAIRIGADNVTVRLIPLDESVIRTLSPDSWRALSDLRTSQWDRLARLARMHNLRETNVWYVSFFGLAPEARFTPTDVTITSSGREFRPLEIIPLTSGFGEQRLSPRSPQQALYLFDDGLDLSQPLTVTVGIERNTDWQTILRTLDRERALIRSRAGRPRR